MILLLLSCSLPPTATDGVLPPNLTAPASTGDLYRWVDANGDPVTDGETLAAFDDSDRLWRIDPETGEARGRILEVDRMYHLKDDCSDPPWIPAPAPREVIQILEWFTLGPPLVRDDTPAGRCASYSIPLGQVSQDSCNDWGGLCTWVVPLEDLAEVTPPTTSYHGPLRRQPL